MKNNKIYYPNRPKPALTLCAAKKPDILIILPANVRHITIKKLAYLATNILNAMQEVGVWVTGIPKPLVPVRKL